MGKKKKRRANDAPAPDVTNNPFAALGGLRDALPAAEVSKAADGTPTDAEPAPENPATSEKGIARVVLRREKKGRGGKSVTRVEGLPPDTLSAWAKRAKRALGCGATIEGEDLILLGDLVGRAAAFFEAQGVRRVVRGN